jgi:hypothetical protein
MGLSLNDLLINSLGTSSQGTALNVQKLWGSSTGTVVLPTSDTVTAATVSNTLVGYVRGITIVTPAMTGTGTTTLQLVDSKGGTMISQAQDESVTAYYGTTAPMSTDMSWIASANGTQAALGTVSFLVHYEK